MVWGELALAEPGTRECVLTFHPCMSEAVLFTHPGQAVQGDVIQAKVTQVLGWETSVERRVLADHSLLDPK